MRNERGEIDFLELPFAPAAPVERHHRGHALAASHRNGEARHARLSRLRRVVDRRGRGIDLVERAGIGAEVTREQRNRGRRHRVALDERRERAIEIEQELERRRAWRRGARRSGAVPARLIGRAHRASAARTGMGEPILRGQKIHSACAGTSSQCVSPSSGESA
jgi:hypothetical protein